MTGAEMAEAGVPLVIMAISVPTDLLRREILLIPTVAGVTAGVIFRIWSGREAGMGQTVLLLLVSAVPGVFMLAAAFLSEQKIGAGDGLMLLMTGIWCGFMAAQLVLAVSLLLCMLIGLAMRKRELPFVPFLAAGYAVVWLLGVF